MCARVVCSAVVFALCSVYLDTHSSHTHSTQSTLSTHTHTHIPTQTHTHTQCKSFFHSPKVIFGPSVPITQLQRKRDIIFTIPLPMRGGYVGFGSKNVIVCWN